MKTLQLYFSVQPARLRGDEDPVAHKGIRVGWVRAVLISDCDVSHAIARAKPRPGEVFVGAVAVE